jgi:hypothetical protein
MKRLIALPLFALAACATKPTPGIEVRTVEVPVIRVEKCLSPGDIPAKPKALPPRPKSAGGALDVAVAKVLEWEIYGDKAEAVLKGCAG